MLKKFTVVNKLGHVYRDVSTVALSPTLLPQVAGYFGNFVNFFLQFWASVKDTFHNHQIFYFAKI